MNRGLDRGLLVTKLTCVLFGQSGDVFFVENILLRGHPVPQQQHDQDGERGEPEQLKTGSDGGHG